jgi:AsmA protein
MTLKRTRRVAITAIGIGLIPLFLWIGLLLVAPTGWARRQVIAALEARTGRSVRLDSLSVHLLGGLQLSNLSIGSPQNTQDPWLQAADIRLDTGLAQLLRGKLRPSTAELSHASLRVFRRLDGSLELADLIRPRRPADNRGGGACQVESLVVTLANSKIEFIDEPTRTRLHLRDVSGEGLCEGWRLTIRKLEGTLNGGSFRLTGQLDFHDADRGLDMACIAEDVVLDDGMSVIRYIIPPMSGATLKWKGKLRADIRLHGRGGDWAALGRSLDGRGVIALDSIDLDGAPFVNELTKAGKLSRQKRIASIQSDFVLKDRKFVTENGAMNIGSIPLSMHGSTDWDGRIDYRIKAVRLEAALSERARRFLNEIDLDINQLTTVTLGGTVDRMTVQVSGINLDRNPFGEKGLRQEDREKIKLLGRQLRDKLLR